MYMKRVLLVFMATVVLLSMSVAASDRISFYEYNNYNIMEPKNDTTVLVWSEEFPDAYVITEYYGRDDIFIDKSCQTVFSKESQENLVRLDEIDVEDVTNIVAVVRATVFYEEKYITTYTDGDSRREVVRSRLLSKDEVRTIGIENFEEICGPLFDISDDDDNSRGKLSITYVVTRLNIPGSEGSYDLMARANWSGTNILPALNGENSPAVGDDFICLTWGGEFDCYDYFAHADNDVMDETDIYLADATPNEGMAWSYLELQYYQGIGYAYVPEAYANVKIFKNRLTGGGNTTSTVFRYIHTYGEHSSNVSISVGAGSASGSYSLSGVQKQWSLVCTVSSIPY